MLRSFTQVALPARVAVASKLQLLDEVRNPLSAFSMHSTNSKFDHLCPYILRWSPSWLNVELVELIEAMLRSFSQLALPTRMLQLLDGARTPTEYLIICIRQTLNLTVCAFMS